MAAMAVTKLAVSPDSEPSTDGGQGRDDAAEEPDTAFLDLGYANTGRDLKRQVIRDEVGEHLEVHVTLGIANALNFHEPSPTP